ncbi:MAG TPA: DUF4215 domain-containing protein [Nannocystis sp.]
MVERLDATVAEHGGTCSPASEDSGHLDTGTSSSTSTGEVDGSGTEGHSGSAGTSTTSAAETQAGSGGSSSSGGGPVCGDGVVEGDETCDDGNATPDDGCQECARDSIVFITSESYQGYALEGLYGADQRCRSLAAKAYLGRPESFRAWLSTPSMAAADRLLHSRGRYVLTNGLVVAQNWDELTSGALQNPIVVDESSQTKEDYVWTGTLPDGQPALGSEFCGEWKETMGFLIFGGMGRALETDGKWSFVEQGGCGLDSSLYCIEQ